MDLWFARMSRISEIRMGADVDLDQRLSVPRERAGLGRMGRGLRAVVGMVLPRPHGHLSLSLGIRAQGESPSVEGLGFPDERASLWMCVRFAGHRRCAAERRHR